ncbi:unnamed protein product, partial [Iphiclides podalirius]
MFGSKRLTFLILTAIQLKLSSNQVLQFGPCGKVQPVKFFDLEKFLGLWYEVERFPAWYEESAKCASKRFQACGRRIEIEYAFVRDAIQYILHVNSTYIPGDDAVFTFEKNNIDPVGIPLSVIATDYTNYAILYGCRMNEQLDIKYISAWILSRSKILPSHILETAYREINSLSYVSTAYLEPVDQNDSNCAHHWTAHVHAEDAKEEEKDEL